VLVKLESFDYFVGSGG